MMYAVADLGIYVSGDTFFTVVKKNFIKKKDSECHPSLLLSMLLFLSRELTTNFIEV